MGFQLTEVNNLRQDSEEAVDCCEQFTIGFGK